MREEWCGGNTGTPGEGSSIDSCGDNSSFLAYPKSYVCNDYSYPVTNNFYIDANGNEVSLAAGGYIIPNRAPSFDKCTIPSSRQCPAEAQTKTNENYAYEYQGGYQSVSCTPTDTSSCSSGHDCRISGFGDENNSWRYYDSCSSYYGDEDCYCIKKVVSSCQHWCQYSFTANPPSGSSLSSVRYSSLPTGLGSAWHGGTVSFTCEANGCGSGDDADISIPIVVGATDGDDSTDGCSQGTNCSVYTASASAYDVDITWECSGNEIGADAETTEEPYKCSSGTACGGSWLNRVSTSCLPTGITDCSENDGYECKTVNANTAQCALKAGSCTRNGHCSVGGFTTGGSSGEYCSACDRSHNCSGSGICTSCTWNDKWCHPTQIGKIYRSCKTGSDVRRYGFIETCSASQQCVSGSCT